MRRLSACWLPQMVFSSSCTVYGNPSKVPIDEDHPLAAVSPYGRTKLIIEEIFRDYSAADSQWRTILLRYFNPVGAHPSGLTPVHPALISVSQALLHLLTLLQRTMACGRAVWQRMYVTGRVLDLPIIYKQIRQSPAQAKHA